MARKRPEELRSQRWFGPADLRSFGHRSRLNQLGLGPDDFRGRPVIGVLNTWSDLMHCHGHFRERAQDVKRGVWQAGGLPVEIPLSALNEVIQKPTTMLYRNLLAIETEETARSQPLDGLVLMGGCDKTLPGLLMGAFTADLPAIVVPAGPMLRGNWRGNVLGSGSDMWKYWDEKRAGTITDADWAEMEAGIARSVGTCMTAGTASTLAALVEALGMCLPGASSIPAADAAHPRMAAASGRRIVEMVWQDVRPSTLVDAASFDNATTVALAIGGSTNAVIHLVAMARRAGVPLDLDRIDALSRRTPVLANLRPSGTFLMEDFFYAGGIRALMASLGELLDLSRPTVAGVTLGEAIAGAETYNADVIRPRANPLQPEGGLAILRGNLAPEGAVIKSSAASPALLRHTGPAIVFDTYNMLSARLDDPALPVTPASVLVLRNAGPVGGPGMPEWGMLPLPRKLLQAGVRDMVRVSDARMSGTSYGTCVLHVSPESAVGGPLALVRDGDPVTLDVAARRLSLDVDEAELARRRGEWRAPAPHYARGYGLVHLRSVRQAHEGCDYDFLERGAPTPEPEIH
ncbi:MAG: dihydroxy-acid dehydratase [Alphaproteobacteria bacterium]|nr:dihydroxy-acid dehydratase [Alphaproteobacteria bacterium]